MRLVQGLELSSCSGKLLFGSPRIFVIERKVLAENANSLGQENEIEIFRC